MQLPVELLLRVRERRLLLVRGQLRLSVALVARLNGRRGGG